LIEKKALTFEGIQSTAKTQAEITDEECSYSCSLNPRKKGPKPNRQKLWVSLGLVLKLREQQEASLRKLRELLENRPRCVRSNIGDLSRWFEKFNREFSYFEEFLSAGSSREESAEGLREVLGSGKEGDNR
jgi:hypothetical protein